MLKIINAKKLDGSLSKIELPTTKTCTIDAENKLTLFPPIINTYITMDASPKKQLENARPYGITLSIDHDKGCQLVVPDEKMFSQPKPKREVFCGLKIPPALFKNTPLLNKAFQWAATEDLPIAIHSEASINKIALQLAEKFKTTLFIDGLQTEEDLTLIRQAKQRKLLIFAGITHDQLCLHQPDLFWPAIEDNTIDAINTPLTDANFLLPALLNAYHEKKITLEKIAALLHFNPKLIFHIPTPPDLLLIDLDKAHSCTSPPYQGKTLKGWPQCAILDGEVINA